jgi:hypothetical protein
MTTDLTADLPVWQFDVWLGFLGGGTTGRPAFDPDDLTRLLRKAPTEAWRVGDHIVSGGRTLRITAPTSGWQLMAPRSGDDLRTRLEWLLEHLEPRAAEVRQLGTRYRVLVEVLTEVDDTIGSPLLEIDPDIALRLGELGLGVAFDIEVKV